MKKKQIWVSILIAAAVIITTYAFISPVLDTQDDTFAQYVLGNGFSAATLKVTYFEYGFLLYEKLFAFLYSHFSSINWLTFFYILLHLISGSSILYFFIKKKRTTINIFSIAGYIFLFFIPLITKLSYTTTAGHCMIACLFISIDSIVKNENPAKLKLVFVFILMNVALCLRMHIILPLVIIALPFIFYAKGNRAFRKYVLLFSGCLLISLCAFLFHENDYERNIPNWPNIKDVTNAVYDLGNFGFDDKRINLEKDSSKKVVFTIIKNNYLYDNMLLNKPLLQEMKAEAGKMIIGNRQELYWLSTDIKQFLILIFGGFLLLFIYTKDKKQKYIVLFSNVAAAIVTIYLLLFMKFPERIWLLIFLLLFLIIYYPLQQLEMVAINKLMLLVFAILSIAIISIQVVAIGTIKNDNKKEIKDFICANNIVNKQPDNLFIEYKESFPFNNFPALSLPKNYPLNNILFPFFLNTELRSNILKRFGVTDASQALVKLKNVIVIGRPDPAFIKYIYQTQNKYICFRKKFSQCLDLYQVNIRK